MIIHLE